MSGCLGDRLVCPHPVDRHEGYQARSRGSLRANSAGCIGYPLTRPDRAAPGRRDGDTEAPIVWGDSMTRQCWLPTTGHLYDPRGPVKCPGAVSAPPVPVGSSPAPGAGVVAWAT